MAFLVINKAINHFILVMSIIRNVFGDICLVFLMLIVVSCNMTLDKALEISGDNRGELEKVLRHFENDPDRL